MKIILILKNNYMGINNLQLTGKLSDENIKILYSELDFARKIFGNADICSQLDETKEMVVAIIYKIKEKLIYNSDLDFTKEIILLNLKIELNILYIRYSNNSKESDFYIVMEKIISKFFSPEWITRSWEAVKYIVEILSKAKEKWIPEEVIVKFYKEINFKIEQTGGDLKENNPFEDFVSKDLFAQMFWKSNKK